MADTYILSGGHVAQTIQLAFIQKCIRANVMDEQRLPRQWLRLFLMIEHAA